jgi:HAD superfamily hydrolase (TIGR01509 family)
MNIPNIQRKFRCVIYDCDGVLFDSLETNRRLYNYICTSIGRAPLTEEELKYAHMHTVFEAIHFISRNDESLERKALELLPGIDPKDYIPYLKMEPNLLETLKTLKETGIFRAINTNRSTSMRYVLDWFDLWPYFDLVITSIDVRNPKPHPESIEKIIETFHVERKQTVFVGDSEIDQQTAESAGVIFIAYKNREIAKEFFIDDHLALINILGIGEGPSPSHTLCPR